MDVHAVREVVPAIWNSAMARAVLLGHPTWHLDLVLRTHVEAEVVPELDPVEVIPAPSLYRWRLTVAAAQGLPAVLEREVIDPLLLRHVRLLADGVEAGVHPGAVVLP